MGFLFELDQQEERVRALAAADRRLGQLIDAIGEIKVASQQSSEFALLARSLIGQQLSVKAAATIIGRVEAACGSIAAEAICDMEEQVLRGCGVSGPKIRYIKGLAEAECRGELNWNAVREMSDDETISRLTQLKGVGRWTAEMFLIFALGRPDVLSLGDAGLRRSARWLYAGADAEADAGTGSSAGAGDTSLERLAEKWRPYRSLASLYLWEAVNRGLVDRGELL